MINNKRFRVNRVVNIGNNMISDLSAPILIKYHMNNGWAFSLENMLFRKYRIEINKFFNDEND